jgi:hypothetical protein
MPKRQRTVIELSNEELKQFGNRCARLGAEEAIREVRAELNELDVKLQLLKGIVDRRTLAEAYDVTTETIMNWEKRLGFERVDGPDRKRVWYDLEDVIAQVRESGALDD